MERLCFHNMGQTLDFFTKKATTGRQRHEDGHARFGGNMGQIAGEIRGAKG
jgi:hypothetical protein